MANIELPEGVLRENLLPDPARRPGHYLDVETDTVYNLGGDIGLTPEAAASTGEKMSARQKARLAAAKAAEIERLSAEIAALQGAQPQPETPSQTPPDAEGQGDQTPGE